MSWIILLIIAGIVGYVILTYNRLVKLKNLRDEGWSGIDVQLKQRANLIPNLIETVRGYMGHERGVLEKVTELRSKCLTTDNVADRSNNENMLTSALRQLFAVAENYPDLKASQNFIELQKALANIEDQIQLARRYYNGTVRDQNIVIQSFPSNIIANAFKFEPSVYFEIEDTKEREVPTVNLS